jgi:hypothetical protein
MVITHLHCIVPTLVIYFLEQVGMRDNVSIGRLFFNSSDHVLVSLCTKSTQVRSIAVTILVMYSGASLHVPCPTSYRNRQLTCRQALATRHVRK